MLTGCAKQIKNAPGKMVKVTLPCTGPDNNTNNKYFRANAGEQSMDSSVAKKRALTTTRTLLAQLIESKVMAVTEDYTADVNDAMKEHLQRAFEEGAVQTSQQVLTGTRVICEELMQNSETGKYTYYVALELSAGDLAAQLAKDVRELANEISDERAEEIKLNKDGFLDKWGMQ
jgi:hypothetical protein